MNIKDLPPTTSHHGGFSIGVDDKNDVLLVVGSGFWSVETIERHFDDLSELLNRHRIAGKSVRVLVDIREAAVQAPDVMSCVKKRTDNIYESQDRVAVVVPSALAKMQMRRSLASQIHEVFTELDSARQWLGQPT